MHGDNQVENNYMSIIKSIMCPCLGQGNVREVYI